MIPMCFTTRMAAETVMDGGGMQHNHGHAIRCVERRESLFCVHHHNEYAETQFFHSSNTLQHPIDNDQSHSVHLLPIPIQIPTPNTTV